MHWDHCNSRTLLTATCITSALIKSVSKQLFAVDVLPDGLKTVSKLSIECVRVADLLDCCVAI